MSEDTASSGAYIFFSLLLKGALFDCVSMHAGHELISSFLLRKYSIASGYSRAN